MLNSQVILFVEENFQMGILDTGFLALVLNYHNNLKETLN